MLLKTKKSSIILPRRNPLGIIDIPVIFWSPVPSTHTLPATGDFPSGECSARWITPRAARGSRGARSKHTVWLNRSKKLGRSSPGGRGVPPLVETVLRLPPGGPWTSGRDPRGDPPPPRGEGGVPSGVLSDDRAGGVPRGGTPGGVSGTPKRGVPGGVQKCTKYLPKKRKLIVRLFGRTFGAKRGFRTPPDFPENSAQFSCLKFGARILH